MDFRPSAARASLVVCLLFASAPHTGCSSKYYPHPALVESAASHATLVIIRKRSGQASLQPAFVYLNLQKAVRLRSGTYGELHVAPGRYDVEADAPSGGARRADNSYYYSDNSYYNRVAGVHGLQADAAQTYYVIVQIAGGALGDPVWSCTLIGEAGGRSMTSEYARIGP